MTIEKLPQATVGGSYGYGWQQLKRSFLTIFLVGVVLLVTGWVGDGAWTIGENLEQPWPAILGLFASAYMLLVMSVIAYGSDLVVLRCVRGEHADVGEMFVGFRTAYLNIVLANLLVVAIVGIGFVLLIVPGIILAIRLSFVPYLVMDKRLEPVAAVEKSWSMTRGRAMEILLFWLLALALFIVGLLALLIGAFFAHLWIKTAYAAFYHAVDLEEQSRLDANGTAELAGTET